jgi:hypothetical protein
MRSTIIAIMLAAIMLAVGTAFPAVADDDIVIAISGGKFVPSEVPVPAGKKVKLVIRNQDKTAAEFESADLHREKIVQPGGEIAVFVGPLDPGSYEFFDDFRPENRGHLVVK